MDILSASLPDPHDVGLAELNDEFRRTGNGGHIFWKIDAYDPPESYGDPTATRLLTIMLAEEF